MNLAAERTRLLHAFDAIFGPGAAPRAALAPGRVNLIGEHTDYNNGIVLPMAIDRHTAVLFRPNTIGIVRVHAESFKARDEFSIGAIEPQTDDTLGWANYIRGTAWALREKGITLRGGDLYVTSDLPAGAGLSSSAALEIASGLALLELAGEKMDPRVLALCGQRAEHEFAGVRCGIMDQMVVACAREGHALLLDCKTIEIRHIPIELGEYAFAVFDTGVRHALASSEYNKRRAACERAAQILQRPSLRDVTVDDQVRELFQLSTEEEKRTRHILSENLRALAFAESLRRGEVTELGALLNASHRSLSKDYEVSCAELDALAAVLADPAHSGCLGARMTGGGFGGSVIALLKSSAFEHYRVLAKAVARGESILLRPSSGASVVDLG